MPFIHLPSDLPLLPPRKPESHKFDYGRVVVIGGSVGMAGAPVLSAMASLRSGAGLVELLVPDPIATIAAGFDPCVMTLGLPAADGGFAAEAIGRIFEKAGRADAIACGPGLGTHAGATEIARRLWRDFTGPAVFDADAINAIAGESPQTLRHHAGPRILTPHEGELRRLLHLEERPPRDRLERFAAEFAETVGAVVILKGSRSLVTADGRPWHNTTGNPGMATAGAGDVLTGVVAAAAAQKLAPFDAARLAAWVHGRAGDLAAASLGQISLTATDILHALPKAFQEIELAAAAAPFSGTRAPPSA